MEVFRIILAYIAGASWLFGAYILMGKKHFYFTFKYFKEIFFVCAAVTLSTGCLEIWLGKLLYDRVDFILGMAEAVLLVLFVFIAVVPLIWPQDRPVDELIELKAGEYDVASDTKVFWVTGKATYYVISAIKFNINGEEIICEWEGTMPDKSKDILVRFRKQVVVGLEKKSIVNWKYKKVDYKNWLGLGFALFMISLCLFNGVNFVTEYLTIPGEYDFDNPTESFTLFGLTCSFAIFYVPFLLLKYSKGVFNKVLKILSGVLSFVVATEVILKFFFGFFE